MDGPGDNTALLESFKKWLDSFQEKICYNYREDSEKSCDNCIFFFNKGCMLFLFEELIETQLNPESDKTFKHERTKRKNQREFAKWQKELKEAIEKGKV